MIVYGLFFFLAVRVAYGNGPDPPLRLRCNHLASPTPALDDPCPTFSWRLTHSDRDEYPTAYQMLVSKDPEVTNGSVWDSGKVGSPSFYHVKYDGTELQEASQYFWKVRWWDNSSRASFYSEVAQFDTAFFSQDAWNDVPWITAPTSILTTPLLRREFNISNISAIKRATAFVAGLGYFQLFMNGERIGDDALAPGWTRYDVRILYLAYDVTNHVAENNAIGVMLGLGWRDSKVFVPHDPVPVQDKYERVLRLQLLVETADGSHVMVVKSDDQWKAVLSPAQADSVYNGETWNGLAERMYEGWDTYGYLDSQWILAIVVPGPTGEMSAQTMPSIMITDVVDPVAIWEPQKGVFVVDFGQNLAGFCRLKVQGTAGTQVTLRHAEVMMHPPYGPRNGSLYFANLRSAQATDVYYLSGDEDGEVFQPHFTYHGFRYVEVIGYPGTLKNFDIQMLHFHSDVAKTIDADNPESSSSLVVNAIQRNVVRGQRSNLMSVPTDCDQRDERLGWMGDAGLSSDSMASNFDMHAFYLNFLKDIHDEQNSNGSIPDVAPFDRFGGRPADPSWSAAFPQIVWVLLHYYGDVSTAQQYYANIKLYLRNLLSQIPAEGLSHMPGSYGDWVPAKGPKVSISLTSSFSYILNVEQTRTIAEALQEEEDVTFYTGLAQSLKRQFQEAFWKDDHYDNGCQTSSVLPLYLGITPEAYRRNLTIRLLNDIASDGPALITSGIIGAKFLMLWLSDVGRTDIGLQLAEQVLYPSWGRMIFNNMEPATAIWELWNSDTAGPGMDSRNHHMFSSVSGWIRSELFAIKPSVGGMFRYGSQAVDIHVARTLGLSRAIIFYDAHPGSVSLTWQRSGGVQCAKVPENKSSRNPNIPLHDDLRVDCGSDGGMITKVDFADFGLPFGYCGSFGINSKCTSPNATVAVEKICIGGSSCLVPTSTDFWGDPCPDMEQKHLFVQVTCSKPTSISADATVSVGLIARTFISVYGLENPVLKESGTQIWPPRPTIAVVGILSVRYMADNDTLEVVVASGRYSFVLTGENGNHVCAYSAHGGVAHVQCPTGYVVARISFASYGSPLGSCGSYRRGACHAGASQHVVENACLRKPACSVPATDDVFLHNCTTGEGSLSIEAVCSNGANFT